MRNDGKAFSMALPELNCAGIFILLICIVSIAIEIGLINYRNLQQNITFQGKKKKRTLTHIKAKHKDLISEGVNKYRSIEALK